MNEYNMDEHEWSLLARDMQLIDWRTQDADAVVDLVELTLARYNYPEFTIDDLKHNGIDNLAALEVMQCMMIYITLTMI